MPIRPVVNSSRSFERLCVSHFVIKHLFRLVTAATKLATFLLVLLLLLVRHIKLNLGDVVFPVPVPARRLPSRRERRDLKKVDALAPGDRNWAQAGMQPTMMAISVSVRLGENRQTRARDGTPYVHKDKYQTHAHTHRLAWAPSHDNSSDERSCVFA
ncbi:hypothetical protein H634G_10091 [Metarhizium anisopliae BRIP 53293]|uniref:Uncharacterized protein n=1 Tax=Metarhizium anisopliae BRIP 53293 TaxID=1291518 RepID=A0A0D9NKI6_METAN|nr:hypothetical protein H634G_10091 [Metarhizium anisopliae BRIP 53293]KJK94942.1 hypothetical protein H633G_01168 [Metarhizium anisopliae BRIP 53284]